MRLQFNSRTTFERMTVNDFGQDDTSRTTVYFNTPSVVINEGHPLDLHPAIAHLNERVEGFTRRGSGYVLARIDELSASFVKFRPLGAGSFVSTPQWIEKKQAVVNLETRETTSVLCGPFWHICILPRKTQTQLLTVNNTNTL